MRKCLIRFLLINLVLTTTLSAHVEDHFKKILDKSDLHKMQNIDFIYMINLDERPEKWERACKQLIPYNIFPYRFSAVNGWDLSLKQINDVGVSFEKDMNTNLMGTSYHLNQDFQPSHEMIKNVGQTYFAHCMSRGAIGIVLSHLSVLQDAYDSGYETIWVMEDDIEVISDPNEISDLISKLDKCCSGWDVLFTDPNTRDDKGNFVPCNEANKRPNFTPESPRSFRKCWRISKDFSTRKARFGAYSMIVRRSGMKKILDFFKKHNIFLPYDFDVFFAPGIKTYSCNRSLVAHQLENTISDNGAPNYMEK